MPCISGGLRPRLTKPPACSRCNQNPRNPDADWIEELLLQSVLRHGHEGVAGLLLAHEIANLVESFRRIGEGEAEAACVRRAAANAGRDRGCLLPALGSLVGDLRASTAASVQTSVSDRSCGGNRRDEQVLLGLVLLLLAVAMVSAAIGAALTSGLQAPGPRTERPIRRNSPAMPSSHAMSATKTNTSGIGSRKP